MAAPEVVISNIFSKIDTDSDGTISCSEMDVCFKHFDTDGDGKVSRDEWSAGFKSNFGGTTEQAEKVYKYMEKTGVGVITVETLYQLFKNMDSDGNGIVTKDEFHAFWMKLLS